MLARVNLMKTLCPRKLHTELIHFFIVVKFALKPILVALALIVV